MNINSKNFDEITSKMKFPLRSYQIQILDNIFYNICLNKQMQMIIMPNGSGKTILSIIVAYLLGKEGNKVLMYAPDGIHIPWIFSKNLFYKIKNIDLYNGKNIDKFKEHTYDYIITDWFYSWLEYHNKHNQNNLDEKSKDSIKTLYNIMKNSNSKIISFEPVQVNNLIDKTPIIATDKLITHTFSNEEYIQFQNTFVDEYEKVKKMKINYAIKNPNKLEEIKQYDGYLETILTKLDLMQNTLEEIHSDIKEILSIVKEIDNITSENKKYAKIFFEVHNKDDDETDAFISKLSSKITEDLLVSVNQLESQKEYIQNERLLKIKMGNTWNKLDNNSKKFLVTAKLTFMENMSLENLVDYSSVCILTTKAFEIELAKRFISGYIKYLKQSGLKINNYPSSIIKFDNNGKKRCISFDEFTLGNSLYIMGTLPNKETKEKKLNKKLFSDYCYNNLMKGKSYSDIEHILKCYSTYITEIKNKYRNPAAHKSNLSLSDANNCLDYILEVEKILKLMLEDFLF